MFRCAIPKTKKSWHFTSDIECANCGQRKEYIQSLWSSDSEVINSINNTSCCVGCSIMNHQAVEDTPSIYYSELSIIMKDQCVRCFEPADNPQAITVPGEKTTYDFTACDICIDNLFKFMLGMNMPIGSLRLPHNHVLASN